MTTLGGELFTKKPCRYGWPIRSRAGGILDRHYVIRIDSGDRFFRRETGLAQIGQCGAMHALCGEGYFAASPSKRVSHADALGFEIFLVVRICGQGNGELLDDFQAVAIETDDFLGIVGEQADAAHAEIA
jgi:hypothetical protein